jgi:Ca2+-binding RTX toxin-like protein
MMTIKKRATIRATGFLVSAMTLPAWATITINGTSGSDVIDVSNSNEPHAIFAKAGADRILGGSSGDTIDGGSGAIPYSVTTATTSSSAARATTSWTVAAATISSCSWHDAEL